MAPKLAIVAGGGDLPWLLLETCRTSGRECLFLALDGHANVNREPAPDAWVRIGDWGQTLDFLHAQDIEELVFAGTVRRPSLKEIRPDPRGAIFLTRLARSWFGDDSILSAVIKELENEGFQVVSPESLLEESIAREGIYGSIQPDDAALADIQRGKEVVAAIGSQDIGQAVVIQQGVVVAVEAAEGTDAMIDRCKSLLRDGAGGVLVKVPKPGQDRRIDLPTIGTRTIQGAKDAGLIGIAVEAGGALVIGVEEIVKIADDAGIFVVGVPGD
jgi:UDP-2,3-diacylglucosamine hydrolase